mgnify:CR=1 FL=1
MGTKVLFSGWNVEIKNSYNNVVLCIKKLCLTIKNCI